MESRKLSAYRTCNVCGATKPLASYYKSKASRGGRVLRCKSCKAQAQRVYRGTEHGKAVNRRLNKAHHERHKEKRNAYSREWNQNNKIRKAYTSQKANAKERGIEWHFTYEQWLDWWGDDVSDRGCEAGSLVMARFNDEGAYQPGNVMKATHSENCKRENGSTYL